MKKLPLYCLLLFASVLQVHAANDVYQDDFNLVDGPTLSWETTLGFMAPVNAVNEPRLSGVDHPTTDTGIMKLGADGDSSGLHVGLAGGEASDMTVEAWVFCEDNDGANSGGGYQGIVARATPAGGNLAMVRLAWDPDRSEAGDTGDGWVKFQAYNGSTWDYFDMDPADFGATSDGYIVNGTSWPSGWRRFKIEVVGQTVSAYVDDMTSPVVTAEMSLQLSDGRGGIYVYSNGDYAGYFDDFRQEVVPPPPTDFDVIIQGGEVFADGYTSATITDIGIIDERISAMGDLSGFTARTMIDAAGLTVTPGFIDTHTHADSGGARSDYVRQGVTTIIAGNCGTSSQVTNVDAYLDSLEGSLGPNFIELIGHNRLRSAAGLSGSTPTPAQMNSMKNYLRQGMEAGAIGMSTGLSYATGFNSETEELIELAAVVSEYDGVYATHMRSEGKYVLSAVDEAVRIGREAKCRVQISHVKCAGVDAWNDSTAFLAKVDDANASGDIVMMDQYPYTASQTTINVLIPNWAENNWNDALANHRAELEADTAALLAGRGGADRVYLISGTYAHQWLSDVATNLGKAPEIVIIDDIGLNGASAVYHQMIEDDVRNFMLNPRTMIGSDGPTGSHPRGAGTYPRVWGYYRRDLGLFDKQTAVLKTSTLAAEQFNLLKKSRGALRTGYYADIVVFDAETIDSPATFESPTLRPVGIKYLFINGAMTVNNGAYYSRSKGKVIRFNQALEGTGIVAW